MSRIPALGKNMENLPDILSQYQDELDEAKVKSHLDIKGKLLETANVEQATWLAYYDQRRIELYSIVKYMEDNTARIRGKLFRQYTENYSRDISDRAKEKYIDHEAAYLNARELYLEVKEVYDRFESIVNAFQARGFALRNITNLRCQSLEDVAI